jgi:peptidoglycan/LPS O-acetylase OafA/YrhL
MAKLDFFRASAVAMVFVGHLIHVFWTDDPAGSIAHLGVIFFFVHTCLVLFLSLERNKGKAPEFYIRRAFRIYPLAICTILAVLAFHIPSMPWGSPFSTPSLAATLAHLALVQDLTRYDSILVVLWSLPMEVQMYVLLPVLFAIMTKRRAYVLWGVGVALAIASSYALAIRSPLHTGNYRNFLLYTPCFLSGIIAFYQKRGTLSFRAFVLVICGLTGMSLYLSHLPFAAIHAIFPIVAGIAVGRAAEPTNKLLCRVCKLVAKYSYGIYLTHLPLMWLCFRSGHDVLHFIAFLTLATLAPVLVYHAIEERMSRLGSKLASARKRADIPQEPDLLRAA